MLNYQSLKLAPYLSAENCITSIEHKTKALKARMRMADIAGNFANKYNSEQCQLGCDKKEDYNHILKECNKYNNKNTITYNINDLYSDNMEKINEISQEISNIVEDRKVLINGKNT